MIKLQTTNVIFLNWLKPLSLNCYDRTNASFAAFPLSFHRFRSRQSKFVRDRKNNEFIKFALFRWGGEDSERRRVFAVCACWRLANASKLEQSYVRWPRRRRSQVICQRDRFVMRREGASTSQRGPADDRPESSGPAGVSLRIDAQTERRHVGRVLANDGWFVASWHLARISAMTVTNSRAIAAAVRPQLIMCWLKPVYLASYITRCQSRPRNTSVYMYLSCTCWVLVSYVLTHSASNKIMSSYLWRQLASTRYHNETFYVHETDKHNQADRAGFVRTGWSCVEEWTPQDRWLTGLSIQQKFKKVLGVVNEPQAPL